MNKTFTYKYKGTIFSVADNIPISVDEIDEFNEVLFHCFTNIKTTSEIRVVILESWMLLEYYIRSGLSYAFNLSQYQTDHFDPKYALLPNSFQVCLDKLKLLVNSQRSLPIGPPKMADISAPPSLLFYIQNEHPKFYQNLLSIIDEYNRKKYPEYFQPKDAQEPIVISTYNGPYQLSKITSVFENINDDWYKKAKKLNDARNIAAHSYNSEKIYKALGINGANRFGKTQKYCLDLLNDLCFYKICSANTPIDIDMDK